MKKPIVAAGGAKPVGPYTPALLCGDLLYVSGQGSRDAAGNQPADFPGQVRQCLTNVKLLVEAGGLTLADVVYCQIYLDDLANLATLHAIWRETFPAATEPAHALLAVASMPTGVRVEITAVAARRVTRPLPTVREAGGRLYFGGVTGATPAEAMDALARRAKEAGIDLGHFAFVNAYCARGTRLAQLNETYQTYFEPGNAPARASLQVAGLPTGQSVVLTGVAVRDLASRKVVRPRNMAPSRTASPAVWAGDTLYLSAKSGFIPGPHAGIYANSVETQVRQTMRNLLDGLEEAGLDFSHCVAANVYVDDLAEFAKMNGIYGSYFNADPPSRTTVQPLSALPPGDRAAAVNGQFPMLEQVSLVAWRG